MKANHLMNKDLIKNGGHKTLSTLNCVKYARIRVFVDTYFRIFLSIIGRDGTRMGYCFKTQKEA